MSLIYHLAPAERWRGWPDGEPYLPAEYAADGFVHCTAGAALMLEVANRFYCSVPGDFVLLEIDPAGLTAPLKWEAPAHPTFSSTSSETSANRPIAPEFPHIYGPIDRGAVIVVRAVRRSPDGTFTGW
jgi:uncharacterized protein (DUF952 family)